MIGCAEPLLCCNPQSKLSGLVPTGLLPWYKAREGIFQLALETKTWSVACQAFFSPERSAPDWLPSHARQTSLVSHSGWGRRDPARLRFPPSHSFCSYHSTTNPTDPQRRPMDPVSAVGVAAASAQFLGIAFKAIRLCYQIRDNAESATDRNKELEGCTRELAASNAELTRPTTGRVPRRITDVAKKCERLTKEVLDLLQHVRGAGKNVSTARKLFRVMKEAKRIEKLERSLKEEERTLESLLIRDIWSVINADSVKNSTQFKSLDDKVQAVIRDLNKLESNDAGRAARLSKEITSSKAAIERKIDHSAIDVTAKIAQTDTNALERSTAAERAAEQRHQSNIQRKLEDEFLSSLFFNEMNDRFVSIKDAAPNTLEWLFYDPNADECSSMSSSSVSSLSASLSSHGSSSDHIPDRYDRWDNLYNWLRSGTSLYWICGKLGSGKSTLMAHIIQDRRTREGLDIWKGQARLHVFQFFFWRPGSELQKSILGLLRSLLYQICKAEPQFIRPILSSLSTNAQMLPDAWTTKALSIAISKAFEVGSELRFCMFLDGLDEFTGDYNELTKLILRLHVHPHVKICVSSRPEAQIVNRLSHCQQLHLEDLNHADIYNFVQQKLLDANLHLQRIDYKSADLYIADKSEGVFLYAALVTQTVTQGAAAGEDEEILVQRITSVPTGIRELFISMISNLTDYQKQSLAFYISLLRLSERLKVLIFNVAGHYLLMKLPVITLARLGEKTLSVRLEDLPRLYFQTETQIRAQSAGLLDVIEAPGPFSGYYLSQPGNEWWLSPANRISDENWARRRVSDGPPPDPKILAYERKMLCWVHRSAYDFILDADNAQNFGFSETPVEATLQKILAASILHFALAPSCVRVIIEREWGSMPPMSYKKVIGSHGTTPTEIEFWTATSFAGILLDSDGHLLNSSIKQICAVSDRTDFFVGIASSGGRLFLQLAGSLFLDPQGFICNDPRIQKGYKRRSGEPLLRLICTPYPEHETAKNRGKVYISVGRPYEEIESFVKLDLSQGAASVLLSYLRTNVVGSKYPGLEIPPRGRFSRWPLIVATEKELSTCHQLILDGVRNTEQLQDSTEKLIALACVRVHLWGLLHSIWVRLLDDQVMDTKLSSTYSSGVTSQASEKASESEGSDWLTDEEGVPPKGDSDEGSDSEWWTDDDEISETRRWLRSRDRMTIVQQNGEDWKVEENNSGDD
ncbi:hypothetical protein PG993_008001 [Apiospora rasikravindrae]|uniref:NACHT domain-containing protein n=1 Tax=Apiospora rasikravindrae TaxID=990691 RepID=A0ABR1T0W2_9PEZI